MPKISAPTVAEHRHAQRLALLAAAEELIAESGVASVNPRSVAERAGLARSSFYEYFPSKDDLLAAIAIKAFDEWGAEIDAALAQSAPGRDRLRVYVEATMRMTADGKHNLAADLQQADLSPKNFDAVMALHDKLTAPLRAIVQDLDVAHAATQAMLVQGLINAGVQLISHGGSADAVAADINRILDEGLHA